MLLELGDNESVAKTFSVDLVGSMCGCSLVDRCNLEFATLLLTILLLLTPGTRE